MGFLERVEQQQAQLLEPNKRDFVLGPGVVDPIDADWGKLSEIFYPPSAGDYLTTSGAVYACATLRAETLASLPLRLYKKRQGKRAEVTSGKLHQLLKHVNPFWTQERLLRMTELSLCVWGEAFWFLDRGPSGLARPKSIWWGRSDRVRVVPNEKKYIGGFIYDPAGIGDWIPFDPGEVIWMPHPNISDEFEGLSPLLPAQMAADTAKDAMKSNRNIFRNGLQMGGAIFPKGSQTLTPEQAKELEEKLDRRFKGVDKAHRWGVFRFQAETKELGVTPKDAEYLGGLNWSMEDIYRIYKIPLDLGGGQRTYQNVDASLKALFVLCVLPEGRFIASELVEKLLPMFPGEADEIIFDSSEVAVLQEAESEKWSREAEQLDRGAITINEWRESKGKEPVPWGDKPWQPGDDTDKGERAKTTPATRNHSGATTTSIPDYGSPEHIRLLARFETQAARFEPVFEKQVARIFDQQEKVVLALLYQSGRSHRSPQDASSEPFDQNAWNKILSAALIPVYRDIVTTTGQSELDTLSIGLDFNLSSKAVEAFILETAQRFAVQVNQTTWVQLKESLAEGVGLGEEIKQLEMRVQAVMGKRIRSSAETIARTEVLRAYSGAQLIAWLQAEIVTHKSWLATLDNRTRPTHRAAHGQTVLIDSDFTVGSARGPAPGLMGSASEDIKCRCTMIAIVKDRRLKSLTRLLEALQP